MQTKVNDWLAAGARLVWALEPATRTAMAYAAGEPPVAVPASGALDGGDVVPGFALRLETLFD